MGRFSVHHGAIKSLSRACFSIPVLSWLPVSLKGRNLPAPAELRSGTREGKAARMEGREAFATNGACGALCRHESSAADLQNILDNNKRWAASMVARDPNFFKKLMDIQTPEWLWIGCADSRVPANELLGLGPGEVFVQRNVGNLATHKDLNCMACLEYAVNVLKVKHIIVCGHYNCGAVRAALTMPCKTQGLVNLWIQDIRDLRDKHVDALRVLKGDARVDKLVELNVMRQVFNVCTSPIVQNAWDSGQEVAVHGVVYGVRDGVLRELTVPIHCLEDFERYSHDQMENLRHLSLSVLEHMSFEREALRRQSVDRTVPFRQGDIADGSSTD